MGPNDYSAAFSDLPSPQNAMLEGLKFGAGMRELQDKRAADDAAAVQRQQEQTDMAELAQNPTAANIAAFSVKYPKYSEQMKRGWDMVNPSERQAKLEHATQVYSAFNADKPEIALKLMRDQAAALRNSGDERGAGATEAMANLFEHDPTFAKIQTGKILGAMAGPEKFAETFAKMGEEARAQELQPDAVKKAGADARGAVADADTKEVGAKYAEKGVLLDLEKKGWDIEGIKADIDYKKQSSRIAAMQAAYAREGNDLKRQELQIKIDEARVKLDTTVRDRADEAQTQIGGAQAVTNLIDEIFADPESLRAVTGASAWKGKIPGTDNRAVAGKIEQLKNMLALLHIDKLKGPTSDRDILFLKQISANLDVYQDEDQVMKILGKVRDITVRREGQLRKKYGVPTTKEDPGIQPRNVTVDY